MRMVLLSARGYPVSQIATIYECDEATVRRWIERYEAGGAQGLRDLPRPGRPPRANAAAREQIRRMVEAGPNEDARPGYWSVLVLVLHLGVSGLALSASTLRRCLHGLGFAWRRPRHVLPRDPDAPAKMHALGQRTFRAPADAVILCLDECDLHLLPVLRSMWMRRGQQRDVPTPGKNQKRGIFGALELETGRWLYQITMRKRTEEFVAFLGHLLGSYPAQPLLLVLGNASIHHSRALQAWLSEHPRSSCSTCPATRGIARTRWRRYGGVSRATSPLIACAPTWTPWLPPPSDSSLILRLRLPSVWQPENSTAPLAIYLEPRWPLASSPPTRRSGPGPSR
jgi:transposase